MSILVYALIALIVLAMLSLLIAMGYGELAVAI